MANQSIRVTEGQRELIIWLENESNHKFIMDLINDKYREMMGNQLNYYRLQNTPSSQERFEQFSEVHTQYLNEEVIMLKKTLEIFSASGNKRLNVRGRSK